MCFGLSHIKCRLDVHARNVHRRFSFSLPRQSFVRLFSCQSQCFCSRCAVTGVKCWQLTPSTLLHRVLTSQKSVVGSNAADKWKHGRQRRDHPREHVRIHSIGHVEGGGAPLSAAPSRERFRALEGGNHFSGQITNLCGLPRKRDTPLHA